jgi:hypothetical protein
MKNRNGESGRARRKSRIMRTNSYEGSIFARRREKEGKQVETGALFDGGGEF